MEQRSALTELLRRPRVPTDWGEKFTLWIHDDNISTLELILNPELFPSAQQGSCVALLNPGNGERINVRISSLDGSSIFKQRSFQISLHRDVGSKFDFYSGRDVYVRLLADDETPIIKYVTVIFRDQYIGRLPMRQVRQRIFGIGAYTGKRVEVESACIKARLGELHDKDGKTLNSGVLMDEGDLVVRFRSETAKIFIFIQIAEESLEWDSVTGMTFLEKAIDGFLADLFGRWKGTHKEKGANHIVSIILFCRRRCSGDSIEKYEDRYSVVVDWEIHEDWQPVLGRVRHEAVAMASEPETLVSSTGGNVLEAIHLALMIFDRHYMDRDLIKTGMAIICITPGSGRFRLFHNQSHQLAKLAKRKVLDSGVWLQLICLAGRPLHCAPLFIFSDKGHQVDEKYYHPYWMNVMYYQGQSQWEGDNGNVQQAPQDDCLDSGSLVSVDSFLSVGTLDDAYSSDPCDPQASRSHHCPICSQKWSPFNTEKGQTAFDWSPLVALPCLPLRSPFTVDREAFEREFEQVDKAVFTVSDGNILLARGAKAEDFMEELCCLRIAVGFQEISIPGVMRKVFCFAHEVHHIHLQGGSSNQVIIEIFKRKRRPSSEAPVIIQCSALMIKPKNHDDYYGACFEFKPSPLPNYSWAQVDRIMAGADDQGKILSSIYWQSRFVLIPAAEAPRGSLIMATAANEILDDEELRIAGFCKFIEVFQRVALTRATDPTTASSNPALIPLKAKDLKTSAIDFLKISLTTSSCSTFAQQEAARYSTKLLTVAPPATVEASRQNSCSDSEDPDSVADVEPLTRDSEVTKIAVLMQHPLVGLSIRNRRWHWRMYRNVFIGSEAVDWILKFFDDVTTREEAVELGNILLDEGVWDHIFGTHRFLDGYYYYRFSASYDLGTLRKSDPNILRRISSKDNNSLTQSTGVASPLVPGQSPASQRAVVMARCILIDVGKQGQSKTDTGPKKAEWAIIHYDSTHNPKNAYHFRLHWLTCSARLIDDLIQVWSRRALQCGFLLVEAPVEHQKLTQSGGLLSAPFYQPITIKFSVNPPSVKRLNEQLGAAGAIAEDYFVAELLRKHEFILDFESDDKFPAATSRTRCVWSYERTDQQRTQYIHQSGVAIIQMGEEGDRLLWSTNRLLLSSAAASQSAKGSHRALLEQGERIRKELTLLCVDPVALGVFWREKLHLLGQTVGNESILDDIPDAMAESAGLEDADTLPADTPQSILLQKITNLDLSNTL